MRPSSPIAQQAIGSLSTVEQRRTKWQFKTKVSGMQKVQLKRKAVGSWQLTAKSKGSFPAAAVDPMVGALRFTLTVDTTCFTHAATSTIE